MKIIGINGSHRKGKNTAYLINTVLDSARGLGAKTELVELSCSKIKPCIACNKCLYEAKCSIKGDDMEILADKLINADGIVLGSPVYWANVSSCMKNFMDRTRWMHMTKNLLQNKIGAVVTCAGLRNGGQEKVLEILQQFLIAHGLLIAGCRNNTGPILSIGVAGSLCVDIDNNTRIWRSSISEDSISIACCKQLAYNMIDLLQ